MEGGCFCGAIRYELRGELGVVSHCHCVHCRRTSGAAFLTWAACEARRFAFTKGTPGYFQSKPEVTRSFCPSCGTPLTYRHVDSPGSLDVTVGSLDEPGAVAPRDHVFHDRKLPWIHLADGLPTHPRDRTTTR